MFCCCCVRRRCAVRTSPVVLDGRHRVVLSIIKRVRSGLTQLYSLRRHCPNEPLVFEVSSSYTIKTTQPTELACTSDQHVVEVATYTTYKQKGRTSMPSAWRSRNHCYCGNARRMRRILLWPVWLYHVLHIIS